jgi:hypothetical protein
MFARAHPGVLFRGELPKIVEQFPTRWDLGVLGDGRALLERERGIGVQSCDFHRGDNAKWVGGGVHGSSMCACATT